MISGELAAAVRRMISRAVRSWRLLSWSLIRTGTGSGSCRARAAGGSKASSARHRRWMAARALRVTERPTVPHHRQQEGFVAGRRGLVPQGEDIAVRAAVHLLGTRRTGLPRRQLHHRPGSVSDQLVGAVQVWRVGADPHLGAHAVGVDRRAGGGRPGDRVLVEAAASEDPGITQSGLVEERARQPGQPGEVTRVQPYPDRPGEPQPAGHVDGGPYATAGVIGVDQEGRLAGKVLGERSECLLLVAERLDEGVCHGPAAASP